MRVGVFDSGLGGLTVVRSIIEIFEGTKIIYVADTLYAPYGSKSEKDILDRSIKIADYLIKEHKIDALVVACNTATSASVLQLRIKYPNLIVVGTEPAIKPAIELTKTFNIGVLATSATLKGEKYQLLVDMLSKDKSIILFECACTGLVEEIEKGFHETKETYKLLENWLKPMKDNKVDTVVLGCTHYPLVSKSIKKIMGEEINLIETGPAIARRLKSLSEEKAYKNQENLTLSIFNTGNINEEMIKMIFKDSKINKNITIRNCEI